jgi:hypothetical protein
MTKAMVGFLLAGCGGADIGAPIDAPTPGLAIIAWGQSQLAGTEVDPGAANSPPPGIPTTDVLYMRRNLVGNEAIRDEELQPLKVTTRDGGLVYHGPELAIGLSVAERERERERERESTRCVLEDNGERLGARRLDQWG